MSNLDVEPLFMNVTEEWVVRTVNKTLHNKCDSDFQEYKQHHGFAIGSSLSAVMASLFLESLVEELWGL